MESLTVFRKFLEAQKKKFSVLVVLGIFCINEQHLILRDFIAFSKVCVDLPIHWQTPLNWERELFCTSNTGRIFLRKKTSPFETPGQIFTGRNEAV